jgi:hypothetical protein
MRKLTTIAALMMLVGSLAAKTTDVNSIRVSRPKASVRITPVEPKKAGRWHMAENGHAVYCYGPVVTMNVFPEGSEPKRYATECRGASRMVPLHD